jgi:sugar O-acyltransferase (sialic acid O-acetyltransferase NeuD family)
MINVLILGAGGHGHVVADILLQTNQARADCKVVGFLDDDPALADTAILGLPVLGAIAQIGEFNHDAVIIAVGDNRVRARLFQLLRAQGKRMVNAIHPSAVLAPNVRLGEGVMICAQVVVNTSTVIGDTVILNTGCTVDHHNAIGAHAHIAPGVHLGGNVSIGDGALVGIGAAVIPGRSIGDWAVIGAGAVVIKDVPAHTTAVGVPAQVIKQHGLETYTVRGMK